MRLQYELELKILKKKFYKILEKNVWNFWRKIASF